MLLRQDRCWHQNRHLFVIRDGFEGCPQSYFGLAVTDIAA